MGQKRGGIHSEADVLTPESGISQPPPPGALTIVTRRPGGVIEVQVPAQRSTAQRASGLEVHWSQEYYTAAGRVCLWPAVLQVKPPGAAGMHATLRYAANSRVGGVHQQHRHGGQQADQAGANLVDGARAQEEQHQEPHEKVCGRGAGDEVSEQ